MRRVAAVARKLHDGIRARGGKDGHGLRAEDATAEMEAGGAQAELAASLLLGVPWTAGGDGHHPDGPDIGSRTQVRSSSVRRDHHSLIVRPRDIHKYGDVPFLLVIQAGRKFTLLGWMMSYEATRAGRLWNGGDGRRPPAWFVPQEKLHPVGTLEGV